MPRLPRRLAIASITILATGACAAPALAAEQTPLVRAIEKAQPGTDLTFNESLDTTASQHKAILVLVTNAYAREQAANLVARIPAIQSQRAGKAEWLSDIREGLREDADLASAVFTILSGNRTAGLQELDSQTFDDIQFRVNKLTSQADGALGVR